MLFSRGPKPPKFEVTAAVVDAAATLRRGLPRRPSRGVQGLSVWANGYGVRAAWYAPDQLAQMPPVTLTAGQEAACLVLITHAADYAARVDAECDRHAAMTEEGAAAFELEANTTMNRRLRSLKVALTGNRKSGQSVGSIFVRF